MDHAGARSFSADGAVAAVVGRRDSEQPIASAFDAVLVEPIDLSDVRDAPDGVRGVMDSSARPRRRLSVGQRADARVVCGRTCWKRRMRCWKRSARATPAELCEELGDLMMQVVLHAKLAEQAGAVHAGRRLGGHPRQTRAPAPARLWRRHGRHPPAGRGRLGAAQGAASARSASRCSTACPRRCPRWPGRNPSSAAPSATASNENQDQPTKSASGCSISSWKHEPRMCRRKMHCATRWRHSRSQFARPSGQLAKRGSDSRSTPAGVSPRRRGSAP